MTWLVPDEAADPGGRRGRWIFLGIGYALLAVSVLWAAALDRLDPVTTGLAALAAAWLPWLLWVYPRRGRQAPVALYYAGLLAVGGILLARSDSFAPFVSLGYPLGLALFRARVMMAAVAATAITMVLAQTSATDDASALAILLGISVPLLIAGWQLGSESEQRRKAGERLAAALEENAGLHARLVAQAREAGVLDERQRLAREIHDTIAQDLIALITQLRAADGAADEADRRRHTGQAQALAGQALTEARRSVRALRPEPLEGSALSDALVHLAERWSETAGIGHTFEVTGTPSRLAAGIEVTLYRVAQEALANVAKHANATRAGLTLSYLDDMVLLDVRDDGRGFDPGAAGGGFGLGTMRQRVRGAGGTLSVESAPGQGTAVAAAVPALPADLTDPIDPIDPADPGQSAVPTDPGHQAGPAVSADPGHPAVSADPGHPAAPVLPAGPADPGHPGAPLVQEAP
ncbi:histidine kinase [Microtetraspora sp. NBRC 13810]|uniref:histidine kinase n=1 Tax=Microtetraspora sp. NBRC 13810 TaxID=3030990 RepID=UPI0024A546E1|nr:histidine kinase [Microtetraspora sp. NBRC 13810]GLW06106.1 histidine kinase [Microtetraspora sp. NBRC 13810]